LRRAVFITGTDTEIGKTVVSAAIIHTLQEKNISCGVMKPIQCGGDDIQILKEVSQINEPPSLINPYSFSKPFSPHLASKLEKRKIDLEKIYRSYLTLKEKYQVLVVEGAGGLLVPISKDLFMVDLIKRLNIGIIIVVGLRVGAINHSLLTIEIAKKYGLEIIGLIFNQNQQEISPISKEDSPLIISKLSQTKILGMIPYLEVLEKKGNQELTKREFFKEITKKINLKYILEDKLPAKRNKILKDRDRSLVWHPFTQMKDYQELEPLIIEEGKGCFLKDIEGNWYLDGISSLWVNLHGHQKREIDEALISQVNKISHSTLLGLGNVPSVELAGKLLEITPQGLSKFFYSDNGSTAVEIALKIAFQYWQHKKEVKKNKFLTFYNAYHGDTIGSVSVGGIDLFYKTFAPLLFSSFRVKAPYCYRCHLNLTYPDCQISCLQELEDLLVKHHQEISALILEPIVQGAAGMIIQPEGFLKRVRELTKKYQVLMIADEVATGFGRTGKMFACQWERVVPDIMCLAKSITAGYLPLAVTITTEEVYHAFLGEYEEKKTFFHGHTYTGNPLACACGLANLEIFEKEKILIKLENKIKFLNQELKYFLNLEHVGEVRQKGFMVGIELVKNKELKIPYHFEEKIGLKVTQAIRKKRVILRPLGETIVLMPPLSISKDELKFLLEVTYDGIKEVE